MMIILIITYTAVAVFHLMKYSKQLKNNTVLIKSSLFYPIKLLFNLLGFASEKITNFVVSFTVPLLLLAAGYFGYKIGRNYYNIIISVCLIPISMCLSFAILRLILFNHIAEKISFFIVYSIFFLPERLNCYFQVLYSAIRSDGSVDSKLVINKINESKNRWNVFLIPALCVDSEKIAEFLHSQKTNSDVNENVQDQSKTAVSIAFQKYNWLFTTLEIYEDPVTEEALAHAYHTFVKKYHSDNNLDSSNNATFIKGISAYKEIKSKIS